MPDNCIFAKVVQKRETETETETQTETEAEAGGETRCCCPNAWERATPAIDFVLFF